MKKILNLILFSLFCFTTVYSQKESSVGMPQMSEAEMKQLEAEMASFQKEIEALSPEEQADFFKSMEEAVEKIDELSKTEEGKALLDKLDKGEISDEELDQLINQIVGEEEEQQKEEAIEPQTEPSAESKSKSIPSSEQEEAKETLDSIIAHTNAFLVKAATMPDLPGKIKKWSKNQQIDWHSSTSWKQLKAKIEQFVSQLSLLLEQDQKSKEYLHIPALLKNEPLFNNLKKIGLVISEYEPNMQEQTPLMAKMSNTTKTSLQKLLSQYVEAVYTLNIIDELKALMAAFDPEAKKLRELEEAAAKKADLTGKKRLKPGEPIIAGSEHEEDYYPRSMRTSRPSAPVKRGELYIPGAQPTKTYGSSSANDPMGQAGRGGAGSKKAGKKESKQAEDEDDTNGSEPAEKDKKEDKFEALKKQAAQMDEKITKEADAILAKVEDNLQNVGESLKKGNMFANLKGHLQDETDVNYEFATEIIPDLVRELSIRRGALGHIEQLQRKLTNQVAKNNYKNKLSDAYDEVKTSIENALSQLQAISKEWQDLVANISPEKLYAYFGEIADEAEQETNEIGEDIERELQKIEKESKTVGEGLEKAAELLKDKKKPESDALAEVKRKVPFPTSLFEVKRDLESLKKAIADFAKAKPSKAGK